MTIDPPRKKEEEPGTFSHVLDLIDDTIRLTHAMISLALTCMHLHVMNVATQTLCYRARQGKELVQTLKYVNAEECLQSPWALSGPVKL